MDWRQENSNKTVWFHQAGARASTRWPVKVAGFSLVMTMFFIAYFFVLNHPSFPVTTMPATAIDRLIAFQPGALPLYLSLWFYVSLAPALLVERREMLSYGLAAVGMSAIGLIIFFFWPTTVARPDVDWSRHSVFAFLMAHDAAGNACPSLHVAFAVFTAIWLNRLLRQMGAANYVRALNWLWCLGILYSTIATRQHVALDVFAGAALGTSIALMHLRWLQGRQND